MSKLNIDQKTVKELFSAKKTKFLIPDYQRPYAWGEDECQTLWEDLFNFSFPENNCDNFDSESDEYFLGPIVTFKNDKGDMEIIDGQQRLTTLMLLLRAFYDKFKNMKDDKSEKTSLENRGSVPRRCGSLKCNRCLRICKNFRKERDRGQRADPGCRR